MNVNLDTKKHFIVPKEPVLDEMTTLFKVLGDKTRVRILYVLFEAERPVSEIVDLIGKSQSTISHQLQTLKQAGLVKNRRDGQAIYYALADTHVITIFSQMIQHATEMDSKKG